MMHSVFKRKMIFVLKNAEFFCNLCCLRVNVPPPPRPPRPRPRPPPPPPPPPPPLARAFFAARSTCRPHAVSARLRLELARSACSRGDAGREGGRRECTWGEGGGEDGTLVCHAVYSCRRPPAKWGARESKGGVRMRARAWILLAGAVESCPVVIHH